jgi:enamine deaminase RidA (YjgF/YER057c/UK114 family)
MGGTFETRLDELKLKLPPAPPPVGYYVPVLRTGNLVVTRGQLPFEGKELAYTGKVGSDLAEETAAQAARICALNAIAQIKQLIGDLDRVKQIVRIEGYVQSAPGFTAQPQVINGASKLFVDLFGEAGKHTRIAVGVSELPLNAAVELAVWAEVG